MSTIIEAPHDQRPGKAEHEIESSSLESDDDGDDNGEVVWIEKHSVTKFIEKDFEFLETETFSGKDSAKMIVLMSNILQNHTAGSKIHTDDEHALILKGLDDCIAFAPEGSFDSGEAYVSRAIFLYHIRKYEDCLKDCERGYYMDNGPEQFLMFSWYMCRCHEKLNRPLANEIRGNILNRANELERHRKWQCVAKLVIVSLKNEIVSVKKEENCTKQEYTGLEYLHFERQAENAFASKSIKLIKDKNGKKQVIALMDIEPGEIIFVEKKIRKLGSSYVRLHHLCQHCEKQSWTRIPCCYCSATMYCSEKCRSNDWESYHKWICNVIPEELIAYDFFLIFFFDLVEKAEGFDNLIEIMKKVAQIQKSAREPPEFDKLKHVWDILNINQRFIYTPFEVNLSCQFAYYLATRSNFLGKKFEKSTHTLHNEHVVSLAAAILTTIMTYRKDLFFYSMYKQGLSDYNQIIMTMLPFMRHFRHSCFPDASYFTSKNQEMVIYAKHKITKGSKITIGYLTNGGYMDAGYKMRSKELRYHFGFMCTCFACKRNLHPFQSKNLKKLLEDDAELFQKLEKQYQPILKNLRKITELRRGIPYSYIGKIIRMLKMFSENSVIFTIEYELFSKYLHLAYIAYYGNFYDPISTDCSYKDLQLNMKIFL